MTSSGLKRTAPLILAIVLPFLFLACDGGATDSSPGLTRAEVEEMIRAEVANTPSAEVEASLTGAEVEHLVQKAIEGIPEPEPPPAGLTRNDVAEVVQASIAELPQPRPALTTEEAKLIARSVVAAIPPRSAYAEYTKFFVQNAISRYESDGLDATLAYYSRPESVDGQFYVFIVDENDLVIGHPDPQRLGLDVKGWVGTDANGYNFGPDMLSATEDGKWVSYVYQNPESGDLGAGYTGEFELKNAWVVKHDGLLFASGWYVNADDFTKAMVSTAAGVFRQAGLEGTIAYFASPESDFAGLAATIGYYNNAANVEGEWFAFIADESGMVIDHYDKTLVGTDLKDLLGTDMFEATAEGNWVTTENVRVWLVSQDGMIFGSGWQRDGSAN